MQQEKIKCAIYARVSTDHQGDSIENQISQCQEYISRLGHQYDHTDIIVYQDEAVSGYYTSVFDRAEMKRAIQDSRNHRFQLLVFKEVSRVGRDKQENPAIIGMFEQYGVRVVAINDNYDTLNKDNITFDILSVLSEQESKKISARVSSARKQKARRGQWGGEPPIGYQVNRETKKLEIDPECKDIPMLVFDLYVHKGLGTFKVAEYLNQKGIRTKNGNLWSRESVNKLLRNQAYIGYVVYGTRRNQLQREYDDSGKMTKKKIQIRIDKSEWQIIENAHEALIDKAIFDTAQRILSSKSHNRAPRRAYHPLTGILICGKCNQGMICQKRSYKGKEYRYYICKTYHKYGRDVCPQANVNADELEEMVVSLIRGRLDKLPGGMFEIVVNKEKDMERLQQEIKVRQQKKERCQKDQMDLFQQRELFDADTYQQQMLDMKKLIGRLDEEMNVLEAQVEGIFEQITETSSLEVYMEEFKRLELDDLHCTRVLLQEIIKRMVLTDRHLAIEYNYDFGC
ncbi:MULTISPECIES: recombinase family protein [unclassified Paenibacillus]|uniref:recombinase family protein n=1 Tax=unclassified Paenibacillus TaxID=185978 RepID=UPI001AE3936F|nr:MULTISPECIES: recombinase family protein [unclassified Paenibacillus]MBP1154506.1 DNA invertase Pin-like site-specific DNA recombinase [Paenibacillus sp. PvP091]MBP1170110.1 DNA invertase Pin-like site-specific DNA recombinase [Paenibacillus sp. PvR098]MBP2441138.1 DNA invertase Pin-like site-specific DNA recombinase [Paenibacillus sp. PvP052]